MSVVARFGGDEVNLAPKAFLATAFGLLMAAVSAVVVQVLGDVGVTATSVLAELIAWMTGVDIFPQGHPLPPPTAATEPSAPSVLVA